MVILQFNKLIRNKWLWGVFAIIVGGAFAFDFLIDDLMRDSRDGAQEQGSGAGTLAGETVKAADFSTVAEDIRGLGRDRDWRQKTWEVNELAWQTLAALEVAKRDGILATDREIAEMIRNDQSFAVNGQFNFQRYNAILRSNGIAPERYEAFLKRRMTANRVIGAMAEAASWVSPAEVDRAIADMTDQFTVRVARFAQSKDEAAKVVLDDAGLRKWYDANTNSIALPKRLRLRMVAFDATKADIQKKMSVTEDEIKDHYDVTLDQYKTTDTNGVEVTKKYEEVKGEVEKALRQIAAVNFFETNLAQRVYAAKAAKGSSRLDEIAKEEGLNVTTSAWFSVDGGFVSGFMRPATTICPDAEGFNEIVAELDPTSEDLRYGVVTSKRKVWLVECAETSPAHVPTFAEAADIVRPRALAAAKEEAFKKAVEAIAAKGTNAVLAAKSVSTNLTFAISDLKPGDFPDQRAVAGAARKLVPGGISEFTRLTPSTALLVVCVDRKAGDSAKAVILRNQIANELSMASRRALPEAWQKWNLKRLGHETTELSYDTKPEGDEDAE